MEGRRVETRAGRAQEQVKLNGARVVSVQQALPRGPLPASPLALDARARNIIGKQAEVGGSKGAVLFLAPERAAKCTPPGRKAGCRDPGYPTASLLRAARMQMAFPKHVGCAGLQATHSPIRP